MHHLDSGEAGDQEGGCASGDGEKKFSSSKTRGHRQCDDESKEHWTYIASAPLRCGYENRGAEQGQKRSRDVGRLALASDGNHGGDCRCGAGHCNGHWNAPGQGAGGQGCEWRGDTNVQSSAVELFVIAKAKSGGHGCQYGPESKSIFSNCRFLSHCAMVPS